MPFDKLLMPLFAPLLAQSGSETTDFLRQIGNLLAVTCVAGVLWVILMAVVIQRAAERRRRERMGLEPLPGLHTVAAQRLKNLLSPQASAAVTPEGEMPTRDRAPHVTRSRPAPMPAPDLAMLLDDLPEPDLDDMLAGEAFTAPYAQAPALDPEPEPDSDPELDADYDADYDAEDSAVYDDEPQATTIPAANIDQAIPVDEADFSAPDDDVLAAASSAEGEPADSVELLRAWRDLSDGGLILEIGGRRFRSMGELRGTDLERRFVNVVRDLTALAKMPASPAAAQPAPPPLRKASPPTQDAPPPTKPTVSGTPDDMPSMSSGSMLRQMRRVAMGQAPDLPESQPVLSIPDQIELLLQNRLAGLDAFSGREIHVRPSMGGGVRIEVDGQFFDGIGAVEDDDVRALLSGVVRDWEKSQ